MAATSVYYDMATKRLDAQMQQIDQLATKAGTLLVVASGVLPVFAGLLSLTALPSDGTARGLVLGTLAVACAVYGVLLWLLYRAYQASKWRLRPDLATLGAYSAGGDYDEQDMQQWVANECSQSWRDNEPLIRQKAAYVNWAQVALPVEVILLVVAGAIALLAR